LTKTILKKSILPLCSIALLLQKCLSYLLGKIL
jgi:hypothetical protein